MADEKTKKGDGKQKAAKAPKGAPKADKKGAKPAKDAGKGKEKAPAEPAPFPRLLERYRKEIAPKLLPKYKNPMAVPRIEKVVVNMGVGEASANEKLLEEATRDLGQITGQRPVVTRARQSVSGFKLREGMRIGCKVTLRGKRMWEFLDRVISVAVPRIRDFRGLSPTAFDGRGNYSMGLSEQIVFPEINVDKLEHVQGMNVTIVTSARDNDGSRELLGMLGMPFRKA